MRTLKGEIVDLIRLEGPLPVDRYMALCLGHPTLGYYTTRDPFGANGDFITAPEISQVFGELIGLWAAQVWLDMGSPSPFRLVEVGPGRGTLMADALRAIARALPPMLAALELHMVETSPVLTEMQQSRLANAVVQQHWHDSLENALQGPLILIANEFLDALPVKQFQMTASGWRERLVGLSASGKLAFGLAPTPTPLAALHPVGTIVEVPIASDAAVATLAAHIVRHGGAALLIDYGSTKGGTGDTLQAVQNQRFADPLHDPGNADLTTQVDFARVATLARRCGAQVHGPVTQGRFLTGLGLKQRADVLKRSASDTEARSLDAAIARLVEPGERGMGDLFKVIALSHPALAALPGFDSPPGERQ